MEVIIPRRNRRRVAQPFRYTYTPEAASWAHAPAPSVFTGDPAGDWELRIYGAGTLTVQSPKAVDVFALGAGGRAGGIISGYSQELSRWTAYLAGGGGGLAETVRSVRLMPGHEYRLDVGDRGNVKYGYTAFKDNTTDSYIVNITKGANGRASYDIANGGNGGSGGAALFKILAATQSAASASGGQDGGDGARYPAEGDFFASIIGGTGQGTTTRAFGESGGDFFATGGDVALNQSVTRTPSSWGDGGAMECLNAARISDEEYIADFVEYDPWPGLIIIRNARG